MFALCMLLITLLGKLVISGSDGSEHGRHVCFRLGPCATVSSRVRLFSTSAPSMRCCFQGTVSSRISCTGVWVDVRISVVCSLAKTSGDTCGGGVEIHIVVEVLCN